MHPFQQQKTQSITQKSHFKNFFPSFQFKCKIRTVQKMNTDFIIFFLEAQQLQIPNQIYEINNKIASQYLNNVRNLRFLSKLIPIFKMHLDYEADYTQRTSTKLGRSSTNSILITPVDNYLQQKTDLLQNSQKKKDLFHLRKLITKHKVKILSNNFISKLRRNNTQRKPPDLNFLQSNEQLNLYDNFLKKLENTEGLILGNIALTVWSFVNIIQITLMVFIFSISIVFKQTQDNKLFLQFRIFSVVLYIADMVLNFTTQRFENGRRLINLRQIGQFYIKSGFFIDFISIVMFPIYLMIDSQVTIIISFVALIKLWNSIKKFQKFQYLYIKSSQKEHYYGLIKVFITNFVIGHFLSILLNLMATINENRNWHKTINITNENWFVKYVWGYYWGTNIMLTVGFGDLVATTYVQAIFLIFIQTISCITLAYNISTVGSLMSELKSKDQKKKKQLKIFHRMSEQNELSAQLTTRISNFIEQSFQIRETFQFQEEDQVISSLPKGIQSQYRIEANKILFDNIGFLNNMSSKTLVNLAQNIQRKISHPEEIIKKKGALGNFTIISNGTIGLCCRKQYSILNGMPIQKITVDKGGKPKLVSLDFIKGKFYQFDVKSLGYSIIYFLERTKFMQCLKDFQLDYQFFCTMRDRDEYLFGQNELYKCSICKSEYHNKFNCNRLHFVPIQQHVIRKRNAREPKCHRYYIERPKKQTLQFNSILRLSKLYREEYEKFLHHHFGKIYIEKLLISKQHFQKSNRVRSSTQKGISRRIGMLEKKKSNEQFPRFMTETNVDGINNQMQQNYQKIEKLLLRDQNQFKDFWDLEVDQICNFKYYFTSFNAQNLGMKDKLKKDGSFKFIL